MVVLSTASVSCSSVSPTTTTATSHPSAAWTASASTSASGRAADRATRANLPKPVAGMAISASTSTVPCSDVVVHDGGRSNASPGSAPVSPRSTRWVSSPTRTVQPPTPSTPSSATPATCTRAESTARVGSCRQVVVEAEGDRRRRHVRVGELAPVAGVGAHAHARLAGHGVGDHRGLGGHGTAAHLDAVDHLEPADPVDEALGHRDLVRGRHLRGTASHADGLDRVTSDQRDLQTRVERQHAVVGEHRHRAGRETPQLGTAVLVRRPGHVGAPGAVLAQRAHPLGQDAAAGAGGRRRPPPAPRRCARPRPGRRPTGPAGRASPGRDRRWRQARRTWWRTSPTSPGRSSPTRP